MITLSSGMVSIVTSDIVEHISAYLCQDATLYLEVQVPFTGYPLLIFDDSVNGLDQWLSLLLKGWALCSWWAIQLCISL